VESPDNARVTGGPSVFFNRSKVRFLIIAANVAKQLQELGQGFLINLASLLLDAVAHALFEMLVRASGPGNANHGYIQVAISNHMIESGEDLFVCQVSHGSE
jgi:hypothetical protein